MTDLNELMRQARLMQDQMQKAQKEAANLVVVGESGAGLVKVHMNGRHDVKKIELDDGLLSEDKEVIEDLLAAAINDAVKKLEEQNRDALSGMTQGFKLPEGFKFPF
ncbi:MAG: YbaB/EbfC family nucleoid-associated protein [Gammaproteobacteria bacterium]|nr:YbaB/EbfC family nucleoid-associated protein [Gammaproteobacteria bacterium]MDP2141118.1 YbaB/EbfC family nucleoid-associated protein [Gammaproteobacteria bacterium]MDP2349207.1 YbaB/EbfC family nucleoid-associated protein [Gammaproteobacteria bacterium]